MNTNKKISLIAGGLLLLSMFLPYVKMGMIQASLFDVVTNKFDSLATLILVLTIGALVSSFLDKTRIARICFSGVILIFIINMYNASNPTVSLFDFLGIGAYLIFISSLVGVIFSKEE
jgi:hypothetical protein